jgi:glycosyltransferase involved in cell wall biosynthesis
MDINLISPINNLGYGVVGFNILKFLTNSGNGIAYFPIGNPSWSNGDELKAFMEPARKNAEKYNPSAPSVRIWHQHELDMFPSSPRVGWPIFELNKFTDRELHHIGHLDKVIVCSKWAKKIVDEALQSSDSPHAFSDKYCSVVPLGIDPNIFYFNEEEKSKRPYWTSGTTIFLNVGKWEKRKGHGLLLEAFNKAFKPGDDVELWMMNDNPFIGHENDEWKRKYADSPMGAHIKFFPRFENHEHLRKVYHHVDCGISLSAAEGWNLGLPEMMACGVHIVATNYSGHTEYLTKENATLIEPIGMEPANDGKWFHGQGEWATFSMDDIVKSLQSVHEKKQAGVLGINKAGIQTARELTWAHSVDKLIQAIDEAGL